MYVYMYDVCVVHVCIQYHRMVHHTSTHVCTHMCALHTWYMYHTWTTYTCVYYMYGAPYACVHVPHVPLITTKNTHVYQCTT